MNLDLQRIAIPTGSHCKADDESGFVTTTIKQISWILEGRSFDRIVVESVADMEHLKKVLERSSEFRQIFVVTESVFSTEGSIAPFDKIVSLCKKFNCVLIMTKNQVGDDMQKAIKLADEFERMSKTRDLLDSTSN